MSELTTLRKKKTQKYYSVDLRVIESPQLSWEAKGMWTYLISRPDGWEVNRKDLLVRATNGDSSLRKIIKDLQDFGLLEIKRKRVNGFFAGTEWIIVEDLDDIALPHVESPRVENPHVEFPHVENPHDIKETILETTILEETNVKETTTTHAREDFGEPEEPEPSPKDPPLPPKAESLIAEMRALPSPCDSPLSLPQAQRLLQRYGPEACRNQLDWLTCHKPHNAVAFFQSALKNNLPPPKTWLEHQAETQRRKHEEEEAQRRRQERAMMREFEEQKQQKLAAERAAWAKLTPEEKQVILAERERQARANNPMTLSKANMLAKLLPEFRAAALAKMPPQERAEILAKLPLEMQTEYLEGQVFKLSTCLEVSA